jgi:hypothetical protein
MPRNVFLPGVLFAERLAAGKAETRRGIPARSLFGRLRRNVGPLAVPRGSQGLCACYPRSVNGYETPRCNQQQVRLSTERPPFTLWSSPHVRKPPSPSLAVVGHRAVVRRRNVQCNSHSSTASRRRTTARPGSAGPATIKGASSLSTGPSRHQSGYSLRHSALV